MAVSGANHGNLTIQDGTIDDTAGGSPAVEVANGTNGVILFDGVDINHNIAGLRIIDLDGVSATVLMTSGSLNQATNGNGLNIANSGAGTFRFDNLIVGNPNGVSAIELQDNGGANVSFSGFALTTNGERGIFASNGGNLSGQGSVDTSGAPAVELLNGTFIGDSETTDSHLIFSSISATNPGGGADGIALNGVGSLNGGRIISGTTNVSANSVLNALVAINDCAVAVDFGVTTLDSNNGRGIAVINNSEALTIAGGSLINSASEDALFLNNATLEITNAGDGLLDINTTSGNAINIGGGNCSDSGIGWT